MLKIRYDTDTPDNKSEDMDDEDSIEADTLWYFHEDELYYYEQEFVIPSNNGSAAPPCYSSRTRVLHKT